MRHRLLFGISLVGVGLAGFVACVGDSGVINADGGPDVSGQDNTVNPPDAGPDGPGSDGEAGLGPAPTPDGGVIWINRYDSNHAFNDLFVNESGGLNYVVVGGFAGSTFHFGTINLGPATNVDLFAGAVNGSGSSLLAKTSATTPAAGDASSTNVDSYSALAVDSSGNIYAFGTSTSASVTLKDTLTGPTSFVVKLSATGTPLWEHPYLQETSYGVSGPVGLTFSGGKLIVAITYYGSITYDTNTTVTSQGNADVFVTALDPNTGGTQWATNYGSTAWDSVSQVVATPQGDAVLVGTMAGPMNETDAGFSVPQTGDAGTSNNELFVLKVSSTGTPLYALTYGNPSSNVYASGIAYRNGTIAVAAGFSGSVDFGKGTLTSASTDGVVFTIDETTKKTNFSAQLAGNVYDSFTSVDIDPWGEVVAVGVYGASNGNAQIGAKLLPQTSINVSGMALAKWDSTGTLLWAHGYVPTLDGGGAPYSTADAGNPPQNVQGLRVQTTSTGLIVLTGAVMGGTDFGLGYSGPVSTIGTPFKCGGAFNCYILNTCIYCPGVPTDGIIGTWNP